MSNVEDPKMKKPWRAYIVAALGICIFGWFIFPTPYEYTRKPPSIWRINRLTGEQVVSTANGWRTERQLDDEAKEKGRVLEAEQAKRIEESKKLESTRATGYSLEPVKFGSNGNYKLNCVVAYIGGQLKYKVTIQPFGRELKTFVENYSAERAVLLKFTNSSGFEIATCKPSDGFRNSDLRGGFSGIELSGAKYMTEQEFDAIVGVKAAWYF